MLEQLGYPQINAELYKRFTVYQNNKGYGIIVACLKDRVIGIIAWSKSYLFILSKVRFHVEALVVDRQFRRLGIAKKLLNYLEKIAKNHSPSIVDLTSGLRRVADGTHSFYDMLGYCNEGKMAKLYLRKEF